MKQSCYRLGSDCVGTEISTTSADMMSQMPLTVHTLLTIGHSTLPLASFLRALKGVTTPNVKNRTLTL